MLDSGTNKHPENRIHLFDPVGLINDSYGGYRSSSYAVRPPRRPTKSYESFTDHTNTSGGLRTYDSFSEASATSGGAPRSDDSLTDSNNEGLRSYDHSSSKDANGGGGGLRFRVVVDRTLEDESDVSTPRLWKPASSPTSPKSLSPTSSPLHPTSHPSSLNPTSTEPMGSPVGPTPHQYQNMSPSSRTQVIAKGRRDMMEMVRDLPESFYELSLKDIVDQKPSIEDKKEIDPPEETKKPAKETTNTKENNNRELKKQKSKKKKSSKKVNKSESKKKMVRSKSVDSGGFLLRTSVFPSFLGAKKRKKSLSAASSFKISSKPKPQPASTRSMKGVERDWWRRKSCISSESDQSNGLTSNSASSSSSGSSTRSNSINARRSNRFLRSFCFFNGRRIRGKA